MAFNRKQTLRDNIEAIRTAFILDREQRAATTEERAILQRYCGFGGLKCILNPAKELTDAVRWAKSDLELFAPTVELHRLIRENSKDETEYKRFVDSLKASVLTAFYTPKEITDTLADMLADYSVRPARMLEPSAGVGVFVDSVLRHSPDADVMAFEKDLLTGTILRHLYPDKKTRTCRYRYPIGSGGNFPFPRHRSGKAEGGNRGSFSACLPPHAGDAPARRVVSDRLGTS